MTLLMPPLGKYLTKFQQLYSYEIFMHVYVYIFFLVSKFQNSVVCSGLLLRKKNLAYHLSFSNHEQRKLYTKSYDTYNVCVSSCPQQSYIIKDIDYCNDIKDSMRASLHDNTLFIQREKNVKTGNKDNCQQVKGKEDRQTRQTISVARRQSVEDRRNNPHNIRVLMLLRQLRGLDSPTDFILGIKFRKQQNRSRGPRYRLHGLGKKIGGKNVSKETRKQNLEKKRKKSKELILWGISFCDEDTRSLAAYLGGCGPWRRSFPAPNYRLWHGERGCYTYYYRSILLNKSR